MYEWQVLERSPWRDCRQRPGAWNQGRGEELVARSTALPRPWGLQSWQAVSPSFRSFCEEET